MDEGETIEYPSKLFKTELNDFFHIGEGFEPFDFTLVYPLVLKKGGIRSIHTGEHSDGYEALLRNSCGKKGRTRINKGSDGKSYGRTERNDLTFEPSKVGYSIVSPSSIA